MIKSIIKGLMGLALFLFFAVEGQTQEKEVTKKVVKRVRKVRRSTAPKKVDVKNLEKRYWAPKDKSYKVVQNRTYTKTKKFYLSFMPGLMLNEEFSTGLGFTGSLGYYFNDRWGLEAEYQVTNLEDNKVQGAIIDKGGFVDHGKSTNYYGVVANWMPFYAKMSFLGTKIVYFDFSLGLSLGMMEYEQQISSRDNNGNLDPAFSGAEPKQTAVAFGFQVSQSFYLSKSFVLRADYKHRFYNQDLIQGGGVSASGKGQSNGKSELEDSISLNLGISYIF